ncbi:MAG: protein translocase subunit SecD [Patescibacteria group bacterium]
MKKDNIWLIGLFIVFVGSVFLTFYKGFPYKLGLDVSGGTTLTYQADLSNIKGSEVKDVLNGVKDLIERRINFLGVAETSINYTNSGRIIVEIPNIKDPDEAKKIIGETPLLEFRVPIQSTSTQGVVQGASSSPVVFAPTRLTGRFLKQAQVEFDNNISEPYIGIVFDAEGAKLFEEMTKIYVGKQIAIYLDGQPISAPTVREEISGGKAQISGRFTPEEAKILAQRLSQGALPVPLVAISESVINPTLGEKFLDFAVKGGIYGVILVMIFMLLYYRGLGVVSIIALVFYLFFNLAVYKLIGVVLSLSAIAGLILSVGMAVDANILVFERTREEIKRGLKIKDAIEVGFQRAWTSIRDSNITTIISTTIVYFTTTSFVKGFALTLGLGVLISMLTAYYMSRILIIKTSVIWERWQKLI